jgi:hypothetical protein
MQLTSDFMGLSASSISSAQKKQETGMLMTPGEKRNEFDK